MIELHLLGDGGINFEFDQDQLGDIPGGGLLAGDLNGDGIDDLLLSASATSTPTYDTEGTIFVLLGGADLGQRDDNNQITADAQIRGAVLDDRLGYSFAGVGDYNGDGIDDLLVGAPFYGANNLGAVYVVMGRTDPTDARVDLIALQTIVGANEDDIVGRAVADAGDLNEDGFADLLIGQNLDAVAAPNSNFGAVSIAFGTASGTPTLARITGPAGSDLGKRIDGGDDVNGDGRPDIVMSRADNGISVVFGTPTLSGDNTLAALGAGAITITGPAGFGNGVSSAADFNGDGINDLVVTAATVSGIASVYVIFGSPSLASGAVTDLTLGTQALRIDIPGATADITDAVGLGGDFTGDGVDDIIIGLGSGRSLIAFGSPAWSNGTFPVANVDDLPFDFIELSGAELSTEAGATAQPSNGQFVGAAGDVNGDGFADALVHAPEALIDDGISTLVFGRLVAIPTGNGDTLFGSGVGDNIFGAGGADLLAGGSGADTISGQDDDDALYGQAGDDLIFGGAGNDRLFGNPGNDIIEGNDGNDLIRGHPGNDSLRGDPGNDTIFGGGGDDTITGNDDSDALNGNSGADFINGEDGGDTLRGQGGRDSLEGDAGDDLLVGMQGFDTLVGGDGNDTLIGGPANDTLVGGAGIDVFTFDINQGTDVITDFADGTDLLNFSHALNEITIVDGPDGAVVTIVGDPGPLPTTVTLTSIAANQLTAADFIVP